MALNYTHRGHVDGAPGADSAVSGPIPVNAGEILAISVETDSYSGTTAHITAYTTSPNWGFTNLVEYDEQIGGFCGVYALVTAAALSPVIHVEVTGAAAGHRRPSFDIWSITGADLGNPVYQVDRDGFVGRNGSLIFRSAAGTPGNTLALISAVDVLHNSEPYVYGDGITTGSGFMQSGPAGPPGVSGFGTMARWATPDQAYTTAVNLGVGYSLTPSCLAVVMEFRAAPDPPTVDAGLDRTVEQGIGIDRTAGEATHGTPVTTREWYLVSGPGGTTPGVLSTTRVCRLPNTVLGAHVLRYTANSAYGAGVDTATITVILRRPSVNAGPDTAQPMGVIDRTATENAYGTAITSRAWKVAAGSPSLVGTTIGSAAHLIWTPPSLGQWILSYTATSAAGASDPDLCVITVGVTGLSLHIGRTPEPKFAVAVAFGGNLADPDGSEWVFTEVTRDVRIAQGVYLRHGAGDEASRTQPAQCRLTLDNRSGKYSLGGRSPYWPNLRQGTPVQVSTDLGDGSGFQTLFTGYADGWTPVYTTRPTRTGVPTTGDSAVSLVASGNLRRLGQGQPPVISPLRRGLSTSTGVVGYWPCEDEVGARFLASAIPGHPPMDFSGRLHGGSNPGLPAASPRLAASQVFACSGALPLVSDSEWYGTVPDYTGTEIIQLRCLIDVPSAGSINGSVILGMITTGDPGFWELRYMTGGLINVRAWRNFSSLVCDSPINGVPLVPGPNGPGPGGYVGLDGRRGQLGLTLTKSGGNIDWVVDFIEQGATTGYVYGPGAGGTTVPGTSVGKVQRVQTCTDGGHVDVTLGHVVVRKDAYDHPTHVKQLNAWRGETVGERLLRITQENGVAYVQIDPPPPYYPTITDTMGPQPVGTVLDLYRDCETVDGGILWDGGGGPATTTDPTAIGAGLSYTTKRYRESRAPAFTLDAALGEVALPFTPAHDDAYRCNRATVARYLGASAVFEDVTGPLGSGILGRYDDSRQVNCRDDSALAQYAGWMVGQGTVEGYRYPRLSLNLVKNPQLLDEWLAIIPGDRVDVTNLWVIHPAAPVETLRLAVEGYEQTITPHTWDVIMNTSLQRRWSVASVAAETTGGANDPRAEYVARVDTNGTATAAIASAGQTVLTVTVSAGPFWTQRADDYPLTLDVGAVAVRATACSAPSGAQQTFTVDPMPVTRPAGVRVVLWNAPVFGL